MFCFMQQKKGKKKARNHFISIPPVFGEGGALWVSVHCLKSGTCPDMSLISLIREDQHNQCRNSHPNTHSQETQQTVSPPLNLNPSNHPFQSLYHSEKRV